MKLACEVIKAWLVPYSEGALRAHRPYLHAMVRRHLRVCAACRQDEVLLHRTALALRRHQGASAGSPRRGRSKSAIEVPLSSRVLQAIRDERALEAARRAEQRSYPLAAYATAVVLLCLVFAILTQPIGARPWFARYLFAHPKPSLQVKIAPAAPPYPMHDPFAIPENAGAPANMAKHDASLPAIAVRSAVLPVDITGSKPQPRSVAWIPTHDERPQALADSPKPAAVPQVDLTAKEAMTAAEAAESDRVGTKPVLQTAIPLVVAPAAPAQSVPSGIAPLAPTTGLSTSGKGQPSRAVPAEFAHAGRLGQSSNESPTTPSVPSLIPSRQANPIKPILSLQAEPSSRP